MTNPIPEIRPPDPDELHAPGVSVKAHVYPRDTPSREIEFLGVQVSWHPGMPFNLRAFALEEVLRHWQRNVGAVRRAPIVDWDYTVLPGWRIMWPGHGLVCWLELAWRDSQ